MFVRSQAAPLRRQDGFTRPAKVDVSQDMRRGNESEKVRPQGMRAVGHRAEQLFAASVDLADTGDSDSGMTDRRKGKIHPGGDEVDSSPHLEDQDNIPLHLLGTSKGLQPAVKGCGYMTTHSFMKLVTLLTALYLGVRRWLFQYDSDIGGMCESPSACATTTISLVLITIASALAGALFAGVMVCIFSKCYATRYFLHHSWIQLIVDFEPTHDLHTSYGYMVLVCGVLHALAHIVRYIVDNDADLLYTETVNRSGVVATILMVPSVVPMALAYCRRRMTFEFRKAMHMIFVPLVLSLCFHSPNSAIIFSITLVWYLLDRLYFTTRQTFLIDRPTYKAVGRGTLVRIDLPTGYQFKAGSYAQVNCPAISASEWHPFSLFPVPGSNPRAGFHVEAIGDWTQELFRLGLDNPHMPLWITAAQPSSIEKTLYFENVLLVCTGAGITPAVSAAERFAKKKNIHLLWMSREASMIAMFEKQLRRVKSTVHVTGKPSNGTKKAMMELFEPTPAENAELNGERHRRATSRDSSTRGLSAPSREISSRELSARDLSSRPPKRQQSRSERGHRRNESVDSAFSDLTVLEAGLKAKRERTRGRSLERNETGEVGSDDDGDGSGSTVSRNSRSELINGGGGGDSSSRSRQRKEQREKKLRNKGYFPVSLKFGRPNISQFIEDTVRYSTPPPTPERSEAELMAERLAAKKGPRLAQVIERLNTGQRLSKENLMQADISLVEMTAKTHSRSQSRSNSRSTSRTNSRSNSRSNLRVPPEEEPEPETGVANLPWLVVYCGANGTVERAISSVCEELKITWRKEYFSTW